MRGECRKLHNEDPHSLIATEAVLLFYGTLVAPNVRVTDGELLKKNTIEVISMLDPSNSKLRRPVIQIPISNHTTEKRIFEISDD